MSSALAVSLGACAGQHARDAELPLASELRHECAGSSRAVQHRPPWLGWIANDVDMIARCTELRDAPAYALLVFRDASDITVITTVDAHHVIEHCGVVDGRVVLRQPGREPARAYEGMPLFSLGPRRPRVEASAPMEELVQDGKVLGWVHWPCTNERDVGGPELTHGQLGGES